MTATTYQPLPGLEHEERPLHEALAALGITSIKGDDFGRRLFWDGAEIGIYSARSAWELVSLVRQAA